MQVQSEQPQRHSACYFGSKNEGQEGSHAAREERKKGGGREEGGRREGGGREEGGRREGGGREEGGKDFLSCILSLRVRVGLVWSLDVGRESLDF